MESIHTYTDHYVFSAPGRERSSSYKALNNSEQQSLMGAALMLVAAVLFLSNAVMAVPAPAGSSVLDLQCDNVDYWYKSIVPLTDSRLFVNCLMNTTNASCTSKVWTNDMTQILSMSPDRIVSNGVDINSFAATNGMVSVWFSEKNLIPQMNFTLEITCMNANNAMGVWYKNVSYEPERSTIQSFVSWGAWAPTEAQFWGFLIAMFTVVGLIAWSLTRKW
jgi:hypothetical protein